MTEGPIEIALKADEGHFLLGLLPSGRLRSALEAARWIESPARGAVVVRADREEIRAFLDELGNLLLEHGLRPDDEPNEVGLRIEDLIDRFNHPLWSDSEVE